MMIFGRKRRQAEEAKLVAEIEESEAIEEPVEESEATVAMKKAEAQWTKWDADFDREEGPFDYEEVDLAADDVQRLDFGSMVVTPFEGMQMQVSLNQAQEPQAIMVTDGESALEVAAFGAPARSVYLPEIRREIIEAASQETGSKIRVRKGPFGTEIERTIPVELEDGQQAIQISRTWLVAGPSWVLRGVVYGRAAMEIKNEDATIAFTEFFANIVVRRGKSPVAPGRVIPMSIPDFGDAQG